MNIGITPSIFPSVFSLEGAFDWLFGFLEKIGVYLYDIASFFATIKEGASKVLGYLADIPSIITDSFASMPNSVSVLLVSLSGLLVSLAVVRWIT